MRFGVVFPHGDAWASEGQDGPRRFAQAVEGAGFDYLSAPDHVLGADSKTRPGWSATYDAEYPFREVFVLFGFLAGVTTNLELTTAILVLAQRQTAVVAKQMAEVDVLTGGRTRLGVGVGWNAVEFQGMGIDFHTRGAYYEEQIEVLRLLWTDNVVTYEGRFHHIDRAGIMPLPIQRPIPLWLGGVGRQSGHATKEQMDRVVDRIGRLADGWIAGPKIPPETIAESFADIKEAASRAGRDPKSLGLQSSVHAEVDTPRDAIEKGIEERRAIGATNITMETRSSGMSLEENIDVIGRLGEIAAAQR